MQDVSSQIKDLVVSLLEQPDLAVPADQPLLGEGGLLDSMKLVELCLALEDLATDMGFSFDWTSDVAMSRSRSMFRSLDALTEEFLRQKEGA
jgi:hypothetical protein